MDLKPGQRIALVVVLVIGGAALSVLGVKYFRWAWLADTVPQSISAAELIRSGPGDNRHVIITDCALAPDFFGRGGTGGSTLSFVEVWAPITPRTDESEPPEEVHILLKSNQIRDYYAMEQARIDVAARRRVVQGTIVNGVDHVPVAQLAELQRKYPKSAFDECWILEEGRTPPGWLKVIGVLGAAGVFFAAAAGIGLAGFLPRRRSSGERGTLVPR